MTENREPKKYQPDLLHEMITRAEREVIAMKSRGYGGILNIISDINHSDYTKALDIIRNGIGIEATDVRHIDIEKIVLALELGIKRYQFGISEEKLDDQSLAQNIFQIVYQGFGKDGKGWRMGRSELLDSYKSAIREGAVDLRGSPFEDFINTLDFGEEGTEFYAPSLIVLDFPSLDPKKRVIKASDADPSLLSRDQTSTVNKYLHIFSLITQVYPGNFNKKDNPHKNIVVNLIDGSYTMLSARNTSWKNAYDFICSNSIETPKAHSRN